MEKRLIDANKLMQDVEKLLYEGNPIVAFIRKQVDKQPTIDAEPCWIPCEERLPEDSDYHDLWETPDGAVLWCKATGEIGVGWYYESTKNWSDLWDNGVKDVIAWMPLPEPYEGERKDDESVGS